MLSPNESLNNINAFLYPTTSISIYYYLEERENALYSIEDLSKN